jgi:hypothetical protein
MCAKEARYGIGGGHVVAGVQHHQEADARDQQGEHPCETIHPQIELEAEVRNPGCLVFDNPAVGGLGGDRNDEH